MVVDAQVDDALGPGVHGVAVGGVDPGARDLDAAGLDPGGRLLEPGDAQRAAAEAAREQEIADAVAAALARIRADAADGL